MKEDELRRFATCGRCRKKIGHTGLPLFWRVRIERFGVKLQSVERQTGLAMLLGSAPLARVMGTDEDMTTPVMDPVEFAVCEACATTDCCVAQLAEEGAARAEEAAAREGG